MKALRHILAVVAAAGFFTGCGYRGALHASYIPEVTDSTLYPGVKPEYQQLAALMEKLDPLAAELRSRNIRVKVDTSDQSSPGFKFANYELKGVPVRWIITVYAPIPPEQSFWIS